MSHCSQFVISPLSLLGYFGLLSAGLMLIVGGLLFGFRDFFGELMIPEAVYQECISEGKGRPEAVRIEPSLSGVC